MICNKNNFEVVVIQDHLLLCAQFSYENNLPVLHSIFKHELPKNALLDGTPFDIVSLFHVFRDSSLPLLLCLVSPTIHEQIITKQNNLHKKTYTHEKKNLQQRYFQKIASCCTSQPLWYVATYSYTVIIQYLLCIARSKRNLHSITFPLQSLVSLFHAHNHPDVFDFLSKHNTHDSLLLHLQNNKLLYSFYNKSLPYLEKNPALWYAFGSAYQKR